MSDIPSLANLSIRTGRIIAPTMILLLLENLTLVEQDIPYTELAFWLKDKDWHLSSLDYNGISAATQLSEDKKSYRAIILGDSGDYSEITIGDISKNRISNGQGMASVSFIHNKVVAVGIRGKIFDISDISTYSELSTQENNQNIEASCEYISESFLVCGWKGLIALYNNDNSIEQLDSGTNVILTDITCDENGEILACGQKGTIIRGYKNSLRPLFLDDVTVDFWSIRKFKGKIYIASTTALYELSEDENLELVRFPGDEFPTSFYHLDTFEDSLMLSAGQKDAVLFDGKNWNRIL